MWKTLSLCLALAAPAVAGAQQAPAEATPAEVFVDGAALDRQVKQFVQALTQVPDGGQLAQFEDPICPKVAGLGRARNAAVEKRIRRVARTADMPVAGANCVANIVVLVAPEKKAAMAALWARDPAMFGGRSEAMVRDMAGAPGPIAVWKNTSLIDAQGARLAKDNSSKSFYLTKTVGTPSRLVAVTRPYVVASLLVIEAEAIGGITTLQLADFAAMRAFTAMNPAAAQSLTNPTISTLIEDAEANRPVPLSLTEWDLSFLKSLNATSSASFAHLQRPLIERLLKKELEEAQESKR